MVRNEPLQFARTYRTVCLMRFTDNSSDDYNHLEFEPRDTKKGMMQLVGIYALTIALVFGLSINIETVTVPVFSIVVTLLLCGLAFYTVMVRQNNMDQVMATEFQNLIFASAASHGSDFTMFLKVDGTIVYANDGLRAMFPNMNMDDGAALDVLLEEGKVQPQDREKMYSALVSGKGEKLIFSFSNQLGADKQYIVSIQPLRRPPGVFVVRGREYIVSRSADEKQQQVMQSSTDDNISQMLHAVPFGLYIIDDEGRVEFANAHLEAALGYGVGEMKEKGLRAEHLIYKPEEKAGDPFRPMEYKGELLLQRSNRALVKAQIDQHILTDEYGNISGVSATVIFE